jgi:hypothetical protein
MLSAPSKANHRGGAEGSGLFRRSLPRVFLPNPMSSREES